MVRLKINKAHIKVVSTEDRLSEEDRHNHWSALDIISKSRDSLDPETLVETLSEDCVYESQDVMEPLVGKEVIARYLRKRYAFFASLKDKQDIGHFRQALVALPESQNFPCLVFIADDKRQAIWKVSLTERNKIKRIDILLVAPKPSDATIIGNCPNYH
jgi:hypothetical protein